MPGPSSRMYFPLRGNASTLVSGAPGAAFRRRLKVAALLFDKIILDAGMWVGMAGPRGAFELRDPASDGPGEGDWQLARERHHQGRPWHLSMESGGAWVPLVQSSTTISWRATFAPIRRELPHAYDWIEFESFDLLDADKQLAKKMAQEAVQDGLLAAAFSDGPTRTLVAESMTRSVLLAARMRVPVSLDKLHATAAAMFVARGQARPVLGAAALTAVLPAVRDLTWEQVNDARAFEGLPRLRAIMADVEAEALRRGGPLDEAALRAFHAEYAKAARQTESALGSLVRSVAIGGIVSLATLPVAGPVGIAAAVAIPAIIETAQAMRRRRERENSWLTAADRLRVLAAISRPESGYVG